MATTDGLNRSMTVARPRPRASPPSFRTCSTPGSLATARASTLATPPPNRLMIAAPEARSSRVETPSGPTMGMLPSSPAQPRAPRRGRPSATNAAPMPVPAITTAAVAPAGRSCSSSSEAASTSLRRRTGQSRPSASPRHPTSSGSTSQASTAPSAPTRPGTATPAPEGAVPRPLTKRSISVSRCRPVKAWPVGTRSTSRWSGHWATSSSLVPPTSIPSNGRSVKGGFPRVAPHSGRQYIQPALA